MKETTAKKPRAKKEPEEKKPPVFRFFLKDGRQVDTLEGLVVPYNERTATAYRLLSEDD